ncbi:type II secretion system minor pseudopilin GspJ [Thalassolituus pacificus]|uniref:Type II secretion system protein J n=1 Tax=Thalassolituus pacificus TaxID=2975440 RepID=A0A9X3AH79_9GAMM|nr:type II secretion system minor pseudopilin GspJ [Thalassolituus pacificus]MCT7359732.1 type II secretion system minor pseudopilin GspJ [Thalassolituus pacificus]
MRASPVMKGFTLLEVLIAVSITAMIGVASTQLLSNVIDSKQASEVRSEQLVSLQRFNMVVSRDIEQLINRSIRDEYGDKQASLLLDSGDFPIEFTRAGWRNSPVSRDPRAELQRVAYRLEPIDSDVCEPALQRLQSWGVTEPQYDCLVRYFWSVLDRASDSVPQPQVVLEQAERLEIDLLVQRERKASDNQQAEVSGRDWYTAWPALQSSGSEEERPLAIRWRLTLPALGDIERQWLLAWGPES